MTEKYFEKFPIIEYSNNMVVDITRRTAILEKVSTNPYVFYPYEISNNERPDQLSERYYQDPYKSWVLYLTNKIIDPYYEWYLEENEFNNFLTLKYGSYYDTQIKIKYYRNNWINQDSISVSEFDAMTVNQKRYWEPLYGSKNVITSYKRREVDWISSTNKIIQYTVSNSNNFIQDEIVDIVFSTNSFGRGQVAYSANNRVFVQHVSGVYYTSNTVSISGSSYIYGRESNSNVIFTDVSSCANNINSDEEAYWMSVTYYEYESENNEYNKTIRVLDNSLKQVISDNLRDLLKE